MDSKYPRIFILVGILLAVALECSLPAASTPTPDLLATLAASTPRTDSPSADSTPASDQPSGHIVFTCQIFKLQSSNQVCIMNADGSDTRRLTTDDTRQHYYPSLSPDGSSVVYAAFEIIFYVTSVAPLQKGPFTATLILGA